MTSTTATDEVAKRLSAALTERTLNRHDENDALDGVSVLQLMHGHGILKAADHRPAVDMTPKGGYRMESTRRGGLDAGKKDKSAKRMAANRARADRITASTSSRSRRVRGATSSSTTAVS